MVFTQNQIRHFYVGSVAFKTTIDNDVVISVTDTINGGTTRTDIVPLDKVEYVKLSKADALKTKGMGSEVTVNTVEAGKSYVVHVEVCNQAGFGDEESFMWFGAFKAKTSTKADVIKGLYNSFNATIARYSSLPTGEAAWSNLTAKQKEAAYQKIGFKVTTTSTSLKIEPVKPEFILGKSNDRFPLIHVYVSPQDDEIDVTWATSKDYVVEDAGNGTMIAQMAYFYHKSRGDQYDGALWPNNIEYVNPVDSKKKYDVLDIHYYYNGDAENVQKSPKQLTIASEAGNLDALYAKFKGEEPIMDNVAIKLDTTGMTADAE